MPRREQLDLFAPGKPKGSPAGEEICWCGHPRWQHDADGDCRFNYGRHEPGNTHCPAYRRSETAKAKGGVEAG